MHCYLNRSIDSYVGINCQPSPLMAIFGVRGNDAAIATSKKNVIAFATLMLEGEYFWNGNPNYHRRHQCSILM